MEMVHGIPEDIDLVRLTNYMGTIWVTSTNYRLFPLFTRRDNGKLVLDLDSKWIQYKQEK